MFTGIIETLGTIVAIMKTQTNTHFTIESAIGNELKVDQSVSHNGVCLTVTRVEGNKHWVTAIDETLKKTSLGHLQEGASVNLERCMLANGRFDGHIVQGHVDQTAICTSVEDVDGSWLFDFEYDTAEGNVTVEKGSICINGVSLTCFNSNANSFRVAIIPYTYEHTTFKHLQPGAVVNLEFDIVGKYVKRLMNYK
jgi:riboflavin synthase